MVIESYSYTFEQDHDEVSDYGVSNLLLNFLFIIYGDPNEFTMPDVRNKMYFTQYDLIKW